MLLVQRQPGTGGPQGYSAEFRYETRRQMRKRVIRPLLVAAIMIPCGFSSATAAYASSNCVVGPGVTQTATTVTGSSGNDTIDCTSADPGKTINGNGGNDTINGTNFDDTINGNDGNDTITGQWPYVKPIGVATRRAGCGLG